MLRAVEKIPVQLIVSTGVFLVPTKTLNLKDSFRERASPTCECDVRMPTMHEDDANRATIQEEYRYLKLLDAAIALGQNVNIYGKIVEYDQPRQTRGSDIMCTMTLRDMSYAIGLRVLIFAPSMDLIPRVKVVGDIIRFHRVKVTAHKNSPQAVARIHRPSQFLLFDGQQNGSNVPYQQSSKNYTIDPCDGRIVNLFRDWHQNLPAEPVTSSQYKVPIEGLKHGSFFDLCCQLLHIDAGDEDHSFVIYVWDGTDAAPAVIETTEAGGSPERQKCARVPPRDALCGFPPSGTVLPLIPETPGQKLPLALPAVGSWVLFRNLRCRVYNGVYEGVWTRESKLICTLSDDSPSVQGCLRLCKERGPTPHWCQLPLQSITVTDYEHVQFSTLRQVLVYPKATHKFRCLVRVVSTLPSNFMDFCGKLDDDDGGGCLELSRRSKQAHYVYAVRLTLEDPTARIEAYLYGEDAVQFFNGHPAKDLQSQGATVGALERKVNRLLGIAVGGAPDVRNPPWIKCCLKSYYLNKEHPWESRRYRIFGTTLPG